MNTIILTSYYKTHFDKLVGLLKERGVKNIAFIINAQTPKIKENPDYVPGAKGMFIENDFKVKIIDLDKVDLEKDFENIDAIYVMGGNPFYLLKAIKESGFGKRINNLLEKGIIYVGESAGSYVACPTIEMSHWKGRARDDLGMQDLSALGIVPFLVTAHYGEGAALDLMVDKAAEESKYETYKLTNDDMLLVEDGNVKKVTVK